MRSAYATQTATRTGRMCSTRRKADHEEWYTKRYGDLHEVISDDTTLQTFVERGLVVTHRCRTYDRESEVAVNRRTPSPCGTHASAESSPPTPDKGIRGVTLGIYGDGPIEVRPGVVAPAGYYIAIDGAAGDEYDGSAGLSEVVRPRRSRALHAS